MAAEGFQLYIEGLSDIRAVVDILRSPEPDLLDLMRLEAFINQVRIGPDIPSVGENSIQSDLTHNAVVSVPDVAAVRIRSDNKFWLVHSDEPDNFFPEFRSVFQSLVRMPEE